MHWHELTQILGLLVLGHLICDFPLQGDFLARGKNLMQPMPDIPWQWCMGVHCAFHGAAVALITQSPWLGGLEFLLHWLTDVAKCRKQIDFNTDQCVHLATKAIWALTALLF